MKPKLLRSRYVFKTPWWKIRKDTLRFFDGSVSPWYIREVGGVGRVFCLTREGKVVLVRMYKPGAGKMVTELPTGLMEKGESPKATTMRELHEETGYTVLSKNMQKLGVYEISPTETEGKVHLFFAKGAVKTTVAARNPHEDGEVILASLDRVLRYVRNGTIVAMGQVASVYIALDYLGYFKKKK